MEQSWFIQRPRENKLRYLKRIAEKSNVLCPLDAHGRIEHLFECCTVAGCLGNILARSLPGNVNSGGSDLFLAIDILGPDSTIEHVEKIPGRDHLVRIRQLDCSCTIMNVHSQPAATACCGSLVAIPRRWCGFLVGPLVMAIQVAPLSSLPPSLALWKSLSLTLRARTRGVMVQSTRYPVLIAFLSAQLRNFQCHAHTVGSVGDRSAPSDHITVRLTIVCSRVEQQDHPVTP